MRLRTLTALLYTLMAPVYAAAGPEKPTTFDDLIRQGRSAYLASDLDRAEAAYNQACPADFVSTYPAGKAITCDNALASVDEARGNPVRAEQRFLRAVANAERAGLSYQPVYCAKLIDLGEYYHRQGRTADAEVSLHKSVDLARGLTAVMPELLPEALIRLGGLYPDSPQPERGREPLTEALAIVAASAASGRPVPPVIEVARAHSALGMIDLDTGDPRGAEANLRESVALATSALGEDHPVTAAYQTNLALTLLAEDQFERAGILLRRAQFVVESRPSPPDSELAVIYAALSSVAGSENKMAQAEDYAHRALSILNREQRPEARYVAIAQATLAGIYLHSHDLVSAEMILPQAVETQREAAVSPNTLAGSVQLLAELRALERRWREAEALYREALSIYERHGAANSIPVVAPLLRALADVLKHNGGSNDEVRALETRARDILRNASLPAPRA
jgi:tetratricopeptide (TPR) repeat protein